MTTPEKSTQLISKVYFEHKSETFGQLQGRFHDQGTEHIVTFLARMQPPSGFATTYVIEQFNVPDKVKLNFGVFNPDTTHRTWGKTWYTVSYSSDVTAHIVYHHDTQLPQGFKCLNALMVMNQRLSQVDLARCISAIELGYQQPAYANPEYNLHEFLDGIEHSCRMLDVPRVQWADVALHFMTNKIRRVMQEHRQKSEETEGSDFWDELRSNLHDLQARDAELSRDLMYLAPSNTSSNLLVEAAVKSIAVAGATHTVRPVVLGALDVARLTSSGVLAGSTAATAYKGSTIGMFSAMQSIAATGVVASAPVLAVGAGAIGIAAAGVVGIATAGAVGVAAAGTVGIAAAGTVGTVAAGTLGIAAAGTAGIAAAGAVGIAAAGTVGIAAAGALSAAAAGTIGIVAAGPIGIAAAVPVGIAAAGTVGVAAAGALGIAAAGTIGIATAGTIGIATAGAVGITAAGAVGIAAAGVVATTATGAVSTAIAGLYLVRNISRRRN